MWHIMSSTKSRVLTAQDKNTIMNCVLIQKAKQLFGEQMNMCEWKEKQLNVLADEVYAALVPKELERKLNRLPDGVVAVSRAFSVEIGEGEDGIVHHFKTTVQRRMPYSLCARTSKIPNTSPIVSKVREINKKAREHEKVLRTLDSEVRQVLMGIRTVRTLLDRWPEVTKVEGIPPEVLDETPSTALIVLPTNINAMLGIK